MDSSTQLDERTGLLRNEAEARRQLLEDAFDISSVGILRARNVYRTKPPRIVALDVFRGFMMLLQSVEHARIFLTKSKSQAQMEIWVRFCDGYWNCFIFTIKNNDGMVS